MRLASGRLLRTSIGTLAISLSLVVAALLLDRTWLVRIALAMFVFVLVVLACLGLAVVMREAVGDSIAVALGRARPVAARSRAGHARWPRLDEPHGIRTGITRALACLQLLALPALAASTAVEVFVFGREDYTRSCVSFPHILLRYLVGATALLAFSIAVSATSSGRQRAVLLCLDTAVALLLAIVWYRFANGPLSCGR